MLGTGVDLRCAPSVAARARVGLVRYPGMLDPEILESAAGPDHRVLDQLRAPNLNFSAVSISGTDQV
jgi:hypothetical protein